MICRGSIKNNEIKKPLYLWAQNAFEIKGNKFSCCFGFPGISCMIFSLFFIYAVVSSVELRYGDTNSYRFSCKKTCFEVVKKT